jgi:hypothetical protein
MDDTSDEIKEHYREMLMSKTPAERLGMASRMFDTARQLAISGILAERPHLNPAELRAHLFLRMYGSDFSSEEIKKIMAAIPNMQLGEDV